MSPILYLKKTGFFHGWHGDEDSSSSPNREGERMNTPVESRYTMRAQKYLGKISVVDGVEKLRRGGYYNPFTLLDIRFKLQVDDTISIRYGWGRVLKQSQGFPNDKIEFCFFENDPRCIFDTEEALQEAINTWKGRPRG